MIRELGDYTPPLTNPCHPSTEELGRSQPLHWHACRTDEVRLPEVQMRGLRIGGCCAKWPELLLRCMCRRTPQSRTMPPHRWLRLRLRQLATSWAEQGHNHWRRGRCIGRCPKRGRSAIRPYLKTQRDKLWLGGAVSVGPSDRAACERACARGRS